MSNQPKRIFISYAHQDTNFVEKLVAALEQYRGLKIKYDKKFLVPGDSLFEIFDQIQQADFFLVIISKNSIDSKWVKLELSTAFIRRIQVENITIIPLILDDSQVPPAISDTIYVDFRRDFANALKELVATFQLMTPPRQAHPSIELISLPEYEVTEEQINRRLEFYHHILERYDRFLVELSRFEGLTEIEFAEYFKKRILFFEAAKKVFNLEIEALQERTSPDLLVPLEFANRKEEIIQIRTMIESILELLGPSGFGKTYILRAIKEDKFQLAHGISPNSVWHYTYIDFSIPENKKLLTDFSGKLIISKLSEQLKTELESPGRSRTDIIDIIDKLYVQDHKARPRTENIISTFVFMFDSLDGIQEDMIKWLVGPDGPIGESINKKFSMLTPRPIFKMVLASRRPVIKSRSWCTQKILRHSVTALNIDVVQDMLAEALRNAGRQTTQDFLWTWANNIMALTSGHPRCVNRMCLKIADQFIRLPALQQLFEENVIGVILQETLNSYHESIQHLLWCLSPFRRINEDVLLVLSHHKFLLLDGGLRFQFSDQSQLMEQLLKTALFIEDEMKFTFRFEYAVRRILHLWLKYEAGNTAQQLNDIACQMYDERIQDLNGLGQQQEAISTISTEWRRVYIQEAIYHQILKLEYESEKNKDWSKYLETKIDHYLDDLYSRAHKLEVLGRLKDLIWDQWERDDELHEEINRVTNDNQARNRLDQIMRKLIDRHDKKWKQSYIKT